MPIIKNKLPAIRSGLRPALGRGLYRGATMVRDLAAQLAPVDRRPNRPPGPHLFETIQVEPDRPGLRLEVTAGRGLPDPRAVVNELGSDVIFFPPQPYLIPAARAIDVPREVAAELRALIRRNRA